MAKAILLIGDMGTGKSSSLFSLPPSETVIISPNTKDLPWEGAMDDYSVAKGNWISCLKIRKKMPTDLKESPGVIEHLAAINNKPNVKFVVLEDLTHYMSDRMMDDQFIKSQDWGKWNTFGADMFAITTKYIQQMRDDLTVIIIGHTEIKDNGTIGLQTAGKLLDNAIKLPSYFTYVFHSRVFNNNGVLNYKFQTHNDGKHLAKSPLGMFTEDFVDNNMFAINQRIDEYRFKKKPVPAAGPVSLT